MESTEKDTQGKILGHSVYDPEFGDLLKSEYTIEGRSYLDSYSYYPDSYVEDWRDLTDGSRYIWEYASNGKKTKEKNFQQNSRTQEWILKSTTEFSVNEAGNDTEETTNADGTKRYAERDENGNVILSRGYKADGSLDYGYSYQYNDRGQEIRSDKLDSKGKTEYYVISEYDENGNRIKHVFYHPDGSFDFGYTYQYNSDGQQIRENKIDANDRIKSYSIYEYDSAGNRVREDNYNADGQLETYKIYEYDGTGLYTHSIEYRANGTKRWETFYRTSEEGEYQSKYISYNEDGTIYKEYDWE